MRDPTLARDHSPDHRRHSLNELTPDLLAYKSGVMLIVEMKPGFSRSDEDKLLEMIGPRKRDLVRALRDLLQHRKITLPERIDDLEYLPSLGMAASARRPTRPDFAYFGVTVNLEVHAVMPSRFDHLLSA